MMDYGELAKEKISQYFPLFGTFREECEFFSLDNPSFSNGNVVENILIQESVNVIITDIDASLIDDNTIQAIDKLLLVPSKDISFVPKINDKVIRPDGSEWHVVNIKADPKPAMFVCNIRPRIS